jgi:aspartokinase
MLIVMKFGGTSVGSAERIAQAASLVLKSVYEGHKVAVVTSAMSGVTNRLIAAAEQAVTGEWNPALREELFAKHREAADVLFKTDPSRRAAVLNLISTYLDRFETLCKGLSMVQELTPRLLDAISGTGEMLAAPLVAGAIAMQGRQAERPKSSSPTRSSARLSL